MQVQDHGQLWDEYTGTRADAARNALVLAYAGYARMMAAKMFAGRSYTSLEFEEYLQYAQLGLMESIERFDPSRGIRFETFAAARINGAMLSGIEKSSEIQEQIAARRRVLVERAALLGAVPAPVAAHDVFGRLAELAIGLAVGFMLEGSGMHQAEERETPEKGYHGIVFRQLKLRLGELVAELPERQRQVVSGHYLENLPFETLATRMQLTKGRISQLHREALTKLRQGLKDADAMDLTC